MKYSLSCSCGDIMTVRGRTRAKAVRSMKSVINEITLYEHMAQKHIGEAVPTIRQVHTAIEQNLKTAA
jgi:hypothetical protein